ncbi:TRAP transporter small permease [Teichococcus vastitatis]|uniref:TRAP transporter small permease n=1 Tax=Teichococcus vastitatis TaxID=2307076 RepID=UPI000E753D31|nr:TRAP transporter small permease [Pseudoroseomonas vastitatis]
MRRAADGLFTWIEMLLALALAAMVAMVFGNVVLRYLFNDGIVASEELSRFLFLWLTFLGAVVVLRRAGHLGFDTLVQLLPRRSRLLCRAVSSGLTLCVCAIFLWGAWPQAVTNMDNASPVSGLPLGWAYASAVASGIGLSLLALADLILALRGLEPVHSHEGEMVEPGA